MSKGTHWEWRVFGTLPADERKHVERQCTEFVREKILIDEYLWHDDCRANVKIRKKKLKFKHLIEFTADGCQLWREDESSKFTFPLKRSAIERLETDMKVTAPIALQTGFQSIEEFKTALPLFSPSLRIVAIHKQRFLYAYTCEDISFHVEIAHILSPIQAWTICIESPDVSMQRSKESLISFRKARDHLDLPTSMRVSGYVELLAAMDKGDLASKKDAPEAL
jgi:hypothetical protein